jgi:starch phosphorylase
MEEAWPAVAVENLSSEEGDLPVGHDMPVRAEVRLGTLSPEDVVVEVVHGEVGVAGELTGMERVPLQLAEQQDGIAVYQGSVPCIQTGRRGISCRVRPAPRLNPDNPFDANLLTWWEKTT